MPVLPTFAQDRSESRIATAGHATFGTSQAILDLWGQMIDRVTTMLALAPQASACQLVFDALTHEHDIRGALSESGSRRRSHVRSRPGILDDDGRPIHPTSRVASAPFDHPANRIRTARRPAHRARSSGPQNL
jgi:hypothetical protein